ncbi:MAG: glycoside hydrolase family 78 protein [Candidatus Ruminococcus intestinipullorum]|nr:glycoside hydrolase family 78 protein [Candidatus Ruminococcus intestinipullorum]
MRLRDVKVEYRDNPIGLDVKKPRFSWKLESEQGNTMQTAYRIYVTNHDEVGKDKNIVWDSEKVDSQQSVLVEYNGNTLQPETTYHCYIQVWDNHGEVADKEVTFETGLCTSENIIADWITHDFSEEETACPIFFKKFSIEKKVKKARLYATALGLYELSMDGQRVGDSYFTPGWTSYQKRLQYQTYDVTQFLNEQEHRFEITVADGWYKGPFGFTLRPNIYGEQVGALAQLHIFYEDGTKEILKTDSSWYVTTGKIRYSQIYMGETIDCNIQNTEVFPVQLLDADKERIISQESEPVRITKRIKAKEFILTPNGEKVIDFGQNLAGFVEIKLHGKAGEKVIISHAETLDKDGNFYPDTLRQAKSIDTFICDGQEQVVHPHFTFHGFRYIKVEGIENIELSDFTACVLHTDMQVTGSFQCSNEMVNQLQSNIQWGQRGNFLDIPTDCPQRDERLGWTGDAQVFSKTASYNMNTALFFTKWLHDLKSEQTKEFGPPHVVPNILDNQDAAAAWSDAATIIPWTVYQVYEDQRVLEEQYESMKGYIDYITEHCGENGLWQTGFQYGDWLALDKEESADRTGATDKYLVANAYYAYSTKIVYQTAEILEYKEDAKKYKDLYEEILRKFNQEYITATGRMVSETQTGCILALYFNLAEEKYRKRITESLKTNLANHKNHLATGFVGTPYLCHTLSENGLHDLAGNIFLKEDYPSWLYAVKKGATTIWERWNSIMPDGSFDESGMNSLNHYAYGSIGDWMYEKLAGIQNIEPGYKVLKIEPKFIKGITSVAATFESVYGTIRSAWCCQDGKITVDVTVPANTQAYIKLPEKEEVLQVGSGDYHYEYETDTKLELDRFTMDTTLGALLEEPLAVELFNTYMPGMLDGPMIQFAYGMTISELGAFMPEEGLQLFKTVLEALNK